MSREERALAGVLSVDELLDEFDQIVPGDVLDDLAEIVQQLLKVLPEVSKVSKIAIVLVAVRLTRCLTRRRTRSLKIERDRRS